MRILLIAFSFVCLSASAQNLQKEIDEQVWKPFTRAIMTQDAPGFAALHSKDLVRVEVNSKKISNLDDYRKRMEASWPKWKESIQKNGSKYIFELRFLERIANESTAYETGYFKNESIMPDGQKRISYGKFHVVLRKESGTWKILVDSDSNEGGTITDEMFQAAKPIE